ncbi:SLC13 family permease [Rhodopseudomonas palustris]|uniref:SLC13 family permease n=1 Tax=Rhodopseudomonas palustris TaxID=1076 RepID=UPI00064192FA|nr:SLC13 family permease [Rhodopseudomonas palustris]
MRWDAIDWRRLGAILFGFALLALTLVIPPPAGMKLEAWRVAGAAALMATWWISEAVPLPVTALLPLVAFPLLGVVPIREAAAPYADPIIFLFLGGFVLGVAMQRWSLHKRIGLGVVALAGVSPARLCAGFLLSTALLSMWISNSATAIIMLPVATSVLALLDRDTGNVPQARRHLGLSLMLSVAYGASVGGLGTLIGTPANAMLAAYLRREHQVDIGFAEWMAIGVPLAAVLLLAAWLLLTRMFPVPVALTERAADTVAAELNRLGPISGPEARVAVVFGLTAAAWMLRPLYAAWVPGIDDTSIAVIGALLLFLLPSGDADKGRLLGWADFRSLPFDVLILFGSGLSLAAAISVSGLAQWIGEALGGLAAWPPLLLVVTATFAMLFLTELTSNTASAATFIPIGGAIAVGIGLDPVLLALPLALAASCAFMLPVATPPNAIVFASGHITVREMARVGLWMNLISGVVIVALTYALAGMLR